MNTFKNLIFSILFLVFSINSLTAQVNLIVRIDNGSSTTTCTDGTFGGGPEPHWRVEIESQGYTTYPSSGICFTDTPNNQYNENFNCISDYPSTVNVCFRAFEDDGGACVVSQSCMEEICQNFNTPAPGTSVSYSLSVSGASSGTVNFTLIATGSFLDDNTVDTQVACDSLVWIDGNTYYTSNNTATHTLTNASGCDSTVTLDLTVNNANYAVDTHSACDSLTWINGNTYYASNNTASHTLTNMNGCDSVVMLDLTITNTDYSVNQSGVIMTANQVGATYQWIDCIDDSPITGANDQAYIANENGDYAVIVSNNGCIDTSICLTVNSVGILENNFQSEMRIYPNPTKGNLTIDLKKEYPSISVTITSLNGNIIQSKTYNNSQILNLEMGEFASGVYVLMIQSKNEKAVIRVMKE